MALGAVEMHFVTKYVNGGLLIFLLGVIAPLLVYIPWFRICSRKIKGYNGNLRSHISGNVTLCLTFAFLAQVIIDVSFIHSTDNVLFKILISLGINLITYFIALLNTPSIKSNKSRHKNRTDAPYPTAESIRFSFSMITANCISVFRLKFAEGGDVFFLIGWEG